MKWVDYRDKLGVGFSDKNKAKMLRNKIATIIESSSLNDDYSADDYYRFCLMIGVRYKLSYHEEATKLADLFTKNELSVASAVSYYIAFVNTKTEIDNQKELIEALKECLDDLNIAYEVVEDFDGWFVFPKGAKELDNALVSQPLEWLGQYPRSRIAWIKALREYSEATEETASETADKFRKTLETFFQEFFCGSKSIENYKTDYGTYLKSKDVPKELSSNFETLLQAYTNYINNYAKHRDATSDKVLEYLMYQTGNIMRLLITLKQEEASDAD